LVEVEKVFDPFAFAVEGLRTIAAVDGAVEPLVRVAEEFRHGEGIVEVGQSLIRKRLPRRERALGPLSPLFD
jgi:hypothetical protein